MRYAILIAAVLTIATSAFAESYEEKVKFDEAEGLPLNVASVKVVATKP